jgi:hypothetical protein
MYYLAVKNLGVEKCIDKNRENIYEDGQYYSFLNNFFYVKNKIVKSIKIRCVEIPGKVFHAVIYSD